jgi:hypothetical protein
MDLREPRVPLSLGVQRFLGLSVATSVEAWQRLLTRGEEKAELRATAVRQAVE